MSCDLNGIIIHSQISLWLFVAPTSVPPPTQSSLISCNAWEMNSLSWNAVGLQL